MDNNLEKIKMFFNSNLKLKRIIYELAPNRGTDGYNLEYSIMYADKLYEEFGSIIYHIISIAKNFLNDIELNEVKNLLNKMKLELIKCGTDFNKLCVFYSTFISNMDEEFVNKVRLDCKGYSLTCNFDLLSEVKTINELIHLFHMVIINNENTYYNLPLISKRKNFNDDDVLLLGKENEIAKKIFDILPFDFDSNEVVIMSLDNKVLLMVRDYGHALSIEIDIEKDNCIVKYFIPKVCNYMMVNKLKGITPVHEDSKYAVGEFMVDINLVDKEILNLISNTPTDLDIIGRDNIRTK